MSLAGAMGQIALIVGGTQPNATNEPYFYSGVQKGDATGITGINGCYFGPPETIDIDPPFGVVLLGTGTAGSDLRGGANLYQGTLLLQDYVRLQICVGRTSPQTQHHTLISFVDLIPTTFAAKMTLNATTNVLDAFPQDYRFAEVTWANTPYMTVEWRIRVRRDIAGQTYTA